MQDAETYETAWRAVKEADGILVPGGFGSRGVEGMILAAAHARQHRRPYLGICLGMQVQAAVSWCHNKRFQSKNAVCQMAGGGDRVCAQPTGPGGRQQQ